MELKHKCLSLGFGTTTIEQSMQSFAGYEVEPKL